MSIFHAKISGVPQFVSYFAPVHRAMHQLGGQATPKQVYAHIAQHENLTPEDLAQVNQNGKPTFENRAAWARFYMTKVGWMYAPKRGVWALTEQGVQANEITEAQAVAMFKEVATQLKGHEEEVEAPEDNVHQIALNIGLWVRCGAMVKGIKCLAFWKRVFGKTATRKGLLRKFKP